MKGQTQSERKQDYFFNVTEGILFFFVYNIFKNILGVVNITHSMFLSIFVKLSYPYLT